jgi:hypothetical protein
VTQKQFHPSGVLYDDDIKIVVLPAQNWKLTLFTECLGSSPTYITDMRESDPTSIQVWLKEAKYSQKFVFRCIIIMIIFNNRNVVCSILGNQVNKQI